MRSPLPHQRPILKWARHRDRIGFLLQMRLGKTFCTIRWAERRKCNRVLVVAPLSVLPGWADELKAERLKSTLLLGSSRRKIKELESSWGTRGWFLTNPEGLRACPELADREWDCVVLDESTFIRNPRTRVTKVCRRRFSHVRCRAVLTGCVDPESQLDVYEQMAFLNDGFMGCRSYWQFRSRLFYPAGFRWAPKSGVAKRIQREVAKRCYVLTMKQAGLQQKRIFEKRYVDLPILVRRAYRQAIEEYRLGDYLTKWTPVVRNWLAQLAGGTIPRHFSQDRDYYSPHKIRELVSLLKGELAKEPVVVFFRFNREIHLAAAALRKRKVSCETYTGLDDLQQRRQKVSDFSRGRTRVLLVQGKCAQFGLNLSRASAAVFFSNHWDALTRNQCLARIEHPLKKRPSLYIDIVSRNTVDEAVVKALRSKRKRHLNFIAEVQRIFHSDPRLKGAA